VAWAVGNNGTIRKTVNGGATWSGQTSGVTAHLRAVCAVDAATAWAVGDGGVVLKTTDGGATWTRQSTPFSFSLHGMDALDANRVWAVGQAASGRAYLVWGRVNAAWPSWSHDDPVSPDRVFNGADPGDYCGMPVSIGNVNGNARKDLVIGAYEADGPSNARPGCGELYVYNGRARNKVPSTVNLRTTRNSVIYGASAGDGLPYSLCNPCRNLNNDGYDDLVMGAAAADGPGDARPNCGEAYAVFGGSLPATRDLASSPANVTLYGAAAGNMAGVSVAAPRHTGGAYRDIVVGSISAGYAGRPGCGVAWLAAGRASWPATVDLASSADVVFIGAEAYDAFGYGLASADLNGSGSEEVVIGSLNGKGPGNARPCCGEHFIFLGAP